MLDPKAIRWSADPVVTPTQLRDPLYQFVGSTDTTEKRLDEHAIGAYVVEDSAYHFKLHRCHAKPTVLYYRGNSGLLDHPLLAIVGPRKPTSYLTQLTKDICQLLPQYQVSTISGGAQGIDELAHRCCLDHHVPTIVVLGAGFRRMSRHHQRRFLQKVVEQGGLILSERKIDQEPAIYSFPQRNRLIAGLSDVVFVPGASTGSGSLITVDFALQYNIPVATVPGSIYDGACAGTNDYLVEKKVQGVTDFSAFLSQYFISKSSEERREIDLTLSDSERKIVDILQEQSLDVTGLARMTGKEVGELMQLLLHLEMKQLIYCSEPGVYSRK